MATISISASAQKNEFLSRLARIESGTGSSKSTLYVGVDGTVMASSKANAKLKKQALAAPTKPLGLFAAILSLVLGGMALGLALYLRFTITGEPGPLDNADISMAMNGGAALFIALFGGFMLKLPLWKYTPISAIGVLAGVVGFHNLVHVYPSQFSDLFSPGWVDQVVTSTPANSIIWRGQTFTL
jgi:hypothetical protein